MLLFNLASFVQEQTGGNPAADPSGGFGGGIVQYLILIGILFAVFYFLLIRPEKKRRQQMQDMVAGLKPGDKVVTIGGIHGSVVGVTDKTVVLRIAEQVKIEVTRQAIGTVVTPDSDDSSDKK